MEIQCKFSVYWYLVTNEVHTERTAWVMLQVCIWARKLLLLHNALKEIMRH